MDEVETVGCGLLSGIEYVLVCNWRGFIVCVLMTTGIHHKLLLAFTVMVNFFETDTGTVTGSFYFKQETDLHVDTTGAWVTSATTSTGASATARAILTGLGTASALTS